MVFTRLPQNPIITPADVKPSRSDFEVVGAFNAGVARYQNETIMLLRVAERPISEDADSASLPLMDEHGEISIQQLARTDSNYNLSDSRLIVDLRTGKVLLTSISHLRLARSSDGVHFQIDEKPWLSPIPPYENYGAEDPRISLIDGVYYINYTTVSGLGIGTGLVSTRDFVNFERMGVIFPPDNRDVTIFPARFGGDYVCYHRPMPSAIGSLNMWSARSSDLKRWGDYRVVVQGVATGWESGRVGGGAPPILTERGWLSIYHAADRQHRYCLGFILTPEDEPERVIYRSAEPILAPKADYELKGFFGNVVFTCGALLEGDTLRLYYGVSDASMALAEANIHDLLALAK